jgi:PDDEXK-like domain of unknown function (DUF3799)
MEPNEEGLFFGVDAAVYHADAEHEIPSLSSSLAKFLIMDTPRHAFWNSPRLNTKFKSKHKGNWDRGSAAHALVLESDAEIERIDADAWRSAAVKKARDEARASGKVPVLEKDYADLVEMRDEVRAQLDALDGGNPLEFGASEVVMRWLEEFTLNGKPYAVWCRARLDWLNPESDNLYDVKTTEATANPHKWSRRYMWDIGAPYQACMYRRGIRRLTQLGLTDMHDPDFVFLVMESKAPYCLSLVNVPSDIPVPYSGDATADSKLLEAMALWQDCLESNEWPGYDSAVYVAEGPKPQTIVVKADEREEPRDEEPMTGYSDTLPDADFSSVASLIKRGLLRRGA